MNVNIILDSKHKSFPIEIIFSNLKQYLTIQAAKELKTKLENILKLMEEA